MVEFDIMHNGALFVTKLAVLIYLVYYTPWTLKPPQITALTTKYQDRQGKRGIWDCERSIKTVEYHMT